MLRETVIFNIWNWSTLFCSNIMAWQISS